jgi:hypothetical protein
VPNLLVVASGVGLVAATLALWVQRWRRSDHRLFAGLISIGVTLSLFSVVAWAAAAIAPLPIIWALVGTLALLFALRLYRELQEPAPDERPQPSMIELASTYDVAGGSAVASTQPRMEIKT